MLRQQFQNTIILHLEDCLDSRGHPQKFFFNKLWRKTHLGRTSSRKTSTCPEKQDLITLWYLGTQSTVLMTADRFGVTDFSVTRARRNVVGALISVVPMAIKRPNRGEVQTSILDFQRTRGFPDVIGALDGTHIKIDPIDPVIQIYFSCNHVHAYVGWPGSVHDARVLKHSMGQWPTAVWKQTYYMYRLSIPTTRMVTNNILTCWFTDKGTN